jgi:nitronate monooxygenase
LTSDNARHTAITNIFTGRPARSVVNRLMRELGPLRTDVPSFPTAYPAVAPLRTAAEAGGRGDFSPLWAGQNTSGCRRAPAAATTRRLAGAR